MIPTLLLVGYIAALFSRGRIAVLVAGVAWPVTIVLWGDASVIGAIVGGSIFAVVNTALGALVGYYSLKLSCYLRGRAAA